MKKISLTVLCGVVVGCGGMRALVSEGINLRLEERTATPQDHSALMRELHTMPASYGKPLPRSVLPSVEETLAAQMKKQRLKKRPQRA